MRNSVITVCIIISCLLAPVICVAAPESQDIETAFSPEQGATEAVVRAIELAKHSIRVAAYSFTSKPIAAALVEAHKHGIDIQVVLDKSNATEKYSAATYLANEGIPTRINYEYAIMHDKFMVVDDVTVETGSFNYTKAAEQHNAENVIILHNHPDIAKSYLKQWQKLWDEAETYKANY